MYFPINGKYLCLNYATGLAQTAIHRPLPASLFDINFTESPVQIAEEPAPQRQPSKGVSLMEIIRQVYESSILKPVTPYDPNALINVRQKDALKDGREEEIKRICSQYYIDESRGEKEFEDKIEELIWVSTLLLFGTGKESRKPRLDFFLMHIVTSAFFFKAYFRILLNPAHRAALLRAYLPTIPLLMMTRGRPIIKPDLLMSYTAVPRPPILGSRVYKLDKSAIGDPGEDEDYNPWPTMSESVIYAPDSHVLKTMRTLIFAAQKYGDVPPGGAIGAFEANSKAKVETLAGTSRVDGSIFVRAAGMLMDSLGWVNYGQSAKYWDRSALGWDEAWANEE